MLSCSSCLFFKEIKLLPVTHKTPGEVWGKTLSGKSKNKNAWTDGHAFQISLSKAWKSGREDGLMGKALANQARGPEFRTSEAM